MEFAEEVGESSSPPRSYGSFGGGNDVIRNDVYNRLIDNGNEEAISVPDFRELLEAHFNRLPPSYGLDINMDRVEDVLLHQKLLARAKDPDNQPVFHIRFLENVCTRGDDFDGEQISSASPVSIPRDSVNNGALSSNDRNCGGDFETCSKLEDLNLDVRKNSNDVIREVSAEDFVRREEVSHSPIHEIIFSTVDKPKLLSQLSALLSDVGLNIREAHVFSTTDGYSLDVFVVDGWHSEDTEGLYNFMRQAIAESEGSWSGSSRSQSILEKASAAQRNSEDWEIDWRLVKIGEKIAAGSCGDLYRVSHFTVEKNPTMLAAARNHLRLAGAAIPPTFSSGGRAIATSPQTDRQEGNNKSRWTKIKILWLPALFFCAGTDRVFSLRQKTELAEKWESRIKMEALMGNEIDASSSESLRCMEFRKVKCKGVFDEKKSILVLENTATPADPFAYEYSLLTPLIPLPAHPQSVTSPVLVNRGRVPRDWADYRKIENFQSLEIVIDFPRKEHLSPVSQPQPPVESLGVIIRSIILKLQKHPSFISRPPPQPRPVEFVGVIRTGVYSDWLSIDVGTLVRAVGLDPEATPYVEQIDDMSDGGSDSENTVATPHHHADMLARFSTMRKDHIQMMTIWYCCAGGTLYLARWVMRKSL